jgi:hypothetical protein
MYKTSASLVLAFWILWIAPAQSSEATVPAAPPVVLPNGNVMAQLSTMRDNFISTIKSSGFQPSVPPPTILLDNPPSYGDFEEDTNELHISVWSALTKEQQGRFERLSELLNNGKSAEQTFDESVHSGSSYMNLGTGGRHASTRLARITIRWSMALIASPRRTGGKPTLTS